MKDEIISEWVEEVREQIRTQTEYLVSGSAENYHEYTGLVGLIRGLKFSIDALQESVDQHEKEQEDF